MSLKGNLSEEMEMSIANSVAQSLCQLSSYHSGRAETESEQSSEEQLETEAIGHEVDYSMKASAVPRVSLKHWYSKPESLTLLLLHIFFDRKDTSVLCYIMETANEYSLTASQFQALMGQKPSTSSGKSWWKSSRS